MEWTSPQRHRLRTSRGKYSIGQAFNGVNYASVPQEGILVKIFQRPSPVSALLEDGECVREGKWTQSIAVGTETWNLE